MGCSSSVRKWAHPWCRQRQWGHLGAQGRDSSSALCSDHRPPSQLNRCSSKIPAQGKQLQVPGPELTNDRDTRCRHLAEKLLWLKKPNPFWSAAFCPSAIAGEFVQAQRDSSVGSLIGFPVLQPREIKNWDDGVGREDELLYCTLKYLWDTLDKYNLTKT